MQHVIGDVRGELGEILESDGVQTDGGVVIGKKLMLTYALFAKKERGFVHCADEVSWLVMDLAVSEQDHFFDLK